MNSTLSGNYIALCDRAFFFITGPDAKRYLNGQISQSLDLASESQAVFTCVTNAKGKLQGVGFVREWENGYLIDCPIELKEPLFQRLDMYLIADDAELSDISEEITMYHSFSDKAPINSWLCNRIGVKGYDTLIAPNGAELSSETAEFYRISNGIPAWNKELTEDILPPEAKLEEVAISYTKGCYTGQEVISRMKSSGKINKQLTKFSVKGELSVPLDIPNPSNPESKPAGWISSISSNGENQIALGYLNKKFFDQTEFSFDSITLNVLP